MLKKEEIPGVSPITLATRTSIATVPCSGMVYILGGAEIVTSPNMVGMMSCKSVPYGIREIRYFDLTCQCMCLKLCGYKKEKQ